MGTPLAVRSLTTGGALGTAGVWLLVVAKSDHPRELLIAVQGEAELRLVRGSTTLKTWPVSGLAPPHPVGVPRDCKLEGRVPAAFGASSSTVIVEKEGA